jgi:zinc transport system permease protein
MIHRSLLGLVGLLAAVLPLLGTLLMLREEWLAALGLAQLAAAGMDVGTATLGLMAAFALVFVPAWLAFRLAPVWRWTLFIAALIGIGGFLIAFLPALFLDQPFGPVLVAVLVIVASAAAAVPRPFAVEPRPVGPRARPSSVLPARDRE